MTVERNPQRGDFKLCRPPKGGLTGGPMGVAVLRAERSRARGRAWAMGTAGAGSAARFSGEASGDDPETMGQG